MSSSDWEKAHTSMLIHRTAWIAIVFLSVSAIVRGDDAELERAARQVRLKVYHSFRLNRAEYDRRMHFLEETLQQWTSGSIATQDRQELLRWLELLRNQPHLVGETFPQRAPKPANELPLVEPKPQRRPTRSPRVEAHPAPSTPLNPPVAVVPRRAPRQPPAPPSSAWTRQPNKSFASPANSTPLETTPLQESRITRSTPGLGRVERRGVEELPTGRGSSAPQVPSRRSLEVPPTKVTERSSSHPRRPGEVPVMPAPDKIDVPALTAHSKTEQTAPKSAENGPDEAMVNVERLTAHIRSYHLNRAALAEELTQLPAESLTALQGWTHQLQQLRDEWQFISLYYDAVPPRLRQQIEAPRPWHELLRQLEKRRLERWEAIQARNEPSDDPALAHEVEALRDLADEYARWMVE